MFIKPYSDEYLFYDDLSGHYVLTEKAVLDYLGINLTNAAKDASTGIKAFLKRVSMLTYRRIHENTTDEKLRDCIVATTETGRKIIFDAMLEQFFYMKNVGDLSLSIDKEKRLLYFSDTAQEILEQDIPEVGFSLLYAGLK